MSSYKQFALSRENLCADLLQRYGAQEGFAILRSDAGLLGTACDWIFLEPVQKLIVDGRGVFVEEGAGQRQLFISPLAALDEFVAALREEPLAVPWCAGGLSYELLHRIEVVPEVVGSQRLVPDIVFYRYQTVVELRADAAHAIIHCFERSEFKPFWKFDSTVVHQTDLIEQTQGAALGLAEAQAALAPHSNFTPEQYFDAVETIRREIHSGNVYQVNLSQRFTLPTCLPAWELWGQLSRRTPAPRQGFLSYCWQGSKGAHLSSSPELFFERNDDRVRCSPIKGTRRRGESPAVDRELSRELLDSPKDAAELAMIVDLVRNDLGRVAEVGSVRVVKHAELTTLPTVHHLTSHIEARVDRTVALSAILGALFPCGSITGAPKIASMQVISRLERVPRGIFSGALGFVSGNGDAHFNVAIRSGSVVSDQFVFSAGGGVVYDSQPEAEYIETIVKARSLIP